MPAIKIYFYSENKQPATLTLDVSFRRFSVFILNELSLLLLCLKHILDWKYSLSCVATCKWVGEVLIRNTFQTLVYCLKEATVWWVCYSLPQQANTIVFSANFIWQEMKKCYLQIFIRKKKGDLRRSWKTHNHLEWTLILSTIKISTTCFLFINLSVQYFLWISPIWLITYNTWCIL